MKCAIRTAALLLLLGALGLTSSMSMAGQDQSAPAADNTKANQQDQNKTGSTAESQKENSSDREISRQIRRSLMKDKSLSTYAHNVKIITRDGAVTLKGPVRSDEEKQAIEAKTREVAGVTNVDNQLEVQPKQ